MFTTFSAWTLDFLSKAAGHKYIRRIPYASGGKTRYRYIYKVTHTVGGKHALHEDDVTVGAAFMLGADKGSEVHAHVKSVDGDKVTVEYDDGPRKGEKETMSKRDLLSKLDAAHGISQALQGEREKQAKVVSELRASGASEKQIAREQARLDRLSVSAPAPKSEESKKRAAKKPKSAEPAAEEPKSAEPAAEEPKSVEPKSGDEVLDVLLNLDAPENKEVASAMSRVMFTHKLPSTADVGHRLEAERIAAGAFPYELLGGHVEVLKNKYGVTIRVPSETPSSTSVLLRSSIMSDMATVLTEIMVQGKTSVTKYAEALEKLKSTAPVVPSIKQLRTYYKHAQKVMASEAVARNANITQGEAPIQNTTEVYADLTAIPQGLQRALRKCVSETREAFTDPFYTGGHMYATDGVARILRVGVRSGSETGGASERMRAHSPVLFSQNAAHMPTATLNGTTAKAIVAICRQLDPLVHTVHIDTRDGKTRFSVEGNVFATVDAHTGSVPPRIVNPRYLADMLSVEHPITILQDPNAGPTSPLIAHTANTQQILMPRSR